jgi:hypothetical protein
VHTSISEQKLESRDIDIEILATNSVGDILLLSFMIRPVFVLLRHTSTHRMHSGILVSSYS